MSSGGERDSFGNGELHLPLERVQEGGTLLLHPGELLLSVGLLLGHRLDDVLKVGSHGVGDVCVRVLHAYIKYLRCWKRLALGEVLKQSLLALDTRVEVRYLCG